ncbi:hypothetical protein AT575_03460 [Streptococcus penaeicida]|uniref:Flavodoxin domain-containing protein n=1 Tax=Streptococcus penaeicida TaxID=1765960 RepID=A0A2N8LCQ7_9STRE|nr:flavodoxin domain-containing protein [Streptococcus penaeicida]PND47948.1 hypothetical protein AT575_03460 [Streptococcus penaeicida]
MAKSLIIYGSEYGSSEKYAKALAKKLGIDAVSYRQFKAVEPLQTLIYIGSLYAGGVKGMAPTLKKIPQDSYQNLLIASVGLSDPQNKTNTDKIKEHIEQQLPKIQVVPENVFHLRGSIDYSKLKFSHRLLMGMLNKKVKKEDPEKLDSESKQLLETYNKKVDFIDIQTLEPLITRYQQLNAE